MAHRLPRPDVTTLGRRPELPAFCRSRRQSAVVVESNRIRKLQTQLWMVLVLQVSTLLLIVEYVAARRGS